MIGTFFQTIFGHAVIKGGIFGKTCLSLMGSPNRGAYPQELLNLGIREYRQALFKPCRIIYRVLANSVCILDPHSFRRLFR